MQQPSRLNAINRLPGGVEQEQEFLLALAHGLHLAQPIDAGLPLVQGVRHRRPEPGQPVLAQVVSGSLFQTLDDCFVAEDTGDEDERHIQAAFLHQAKRTQGVEPAEVIVGKDELGGRVESGEELGLGLHPLAGRVETCTTELVEDQPGVSLVVFEHEDTERSGHQHLNLCVVTRVLEVESHDVGRHASSWPCTPGVRAHFSMRKNACPS